MNAIPTVSIRHSHLDGNLAPYVSLGRSRPDLQPGLPAAPRTSELIFAEGEHVRLECDALLASRPDMLLTGSPEDVAALDARIELARIRTLQANTQHAAALVAEAKASAADEAEQARRKGLRKAGMKAGAEAAKLTDRYVVLARELAGVLGQLREQEGRIAEANAALPDGAEPVPPGEPFNGTETIPMRSETTHDLVWVDARTGQPAGILAGNDLRHRVAKTIERRVAVPSIPGEPHVPLSHRVTLPGLGRDAPPIWRSLPQPLRSDTGYRA
ncbi:hypothetical protein [Methylobacterium sp. J-092]|uniref:hypothetical protein n=1 Tax=Methylobacterium sp. J-092 TaxID=2836667 RepID=UPI001FB91E71|nr:hypothetical protein [Methylobacterium sp. J-092]MCJ2008216.1 hypothetical protein [Methylobacterium sp. J-092]